MRRILAALALAGLAPLATPEAGAAPPDSWSEAAAYFQQYSGSKKPDERAAAAGKLSAGMDGKHDKLAATLLLSLLGSELGREDGGRKEDQVSGDVLRNCEESLRKVSTADAAEVVIREAKKGRSPRLRFYLARSLGGMKGDAAARTLAELADEKDPLIVVGVAGGLKDRGDEASVDLVLKILRRKDCPWEAAVEALGALEKLKKPDKSVDGLIELLESQKVEPGRVRTRLLDALQKLSGIAEANCEDPAWWKEAWAAKKAGQDVPKPDGAAIAPEPAEIYGIKIRSNRVVFLLDSCGGMDGAFSRQTPAPAKAPEPKKADEPKKAAGKRGGDPVEEAARVKADELRRRIEGRPGRKKIDDMKREFASAVTALDPHVLFGVVWYDNEPRTWKEELVQATWQNKAACLQDLEKASTIGTNGTNFWGALEMALRYAPSPQKPDALQIDRKGNYATLLRGADTFFLVSGGRPTTGKYVSTGAAADIDITSFLAEFEKVLALRPVVVNAVAIGDPDGENDWMTANSLRFVKKLADVTGGQFGHFAPTK
jgi:hypothetical protein